MSQRDDLERIARHLEAKHPYAAAHADDAVHIAVLKILEQSDLSPTRIGSYLYAVASNEMVDFGRRSKRVGPQISLDGGTTEVVDRSRFESQVLDAAQVKHIRAHVERWSNRNIRVVTLVVIDAVVAGEPLEGDRLVEAVSEILDEPLSPGSVRMWKTRGLRRLRHDYFPDYEDEEQDDG